MSTTTNTLQPDREDGTMLFLTVAESIHTMVRTCCPSEPMLQAKLATEVAVRFTIISRELEGETQGVTYWFRDKSSISIRRDGAISTNVNGE